MKMTGGQALARQLVREGVRDIFAIPGVQLDWAVDALREVATTIRFVTPRHEQATSYMADGYARSTGRAGVSMVVPGPGVLNALAGLSTAYACNSRLLFIAGQIQSAAIGRGVGLLHEIPAQSEMLRSLSKWHALARTPAEVPLIVREAFAQLSHGRPRPVTIELPPDVLQAIDDVSLQDVIPPSLGTIDSEAIERAAALLRSARIPVIYAGGGVVACDAAAPLRMLAERLQAPVVMSESGRGALSDRHSLALTALGGRAVLPHADVVLVAGSRFVDGLGRPIATSRECQIIYLNLDPADVSEPRRPGLFLHACAQAGLGALVSRLGDLSGRPPATEAMQRVRSWCLDQTSTLQPQAAYVAELRAAIPDNGVLVSELTQVGYHANLSYPVFSPRTLITPGYQGTLGYGFPTALGVAAGNPGRTVVSITGDGGFGWALQELATARRYALQLVTVVFVDGHFGNVRRIQKNVFGREYQVELTNPDFQALARAFGVASSRVDTPEGLRRELAVAIAGNCPFLIEVEVDEMPSPWHLIHAASSCQPPPTLLDGWLNAR